jgi:hypothetical protein
MYVDNKCLLVDDVCTVIRYVLCLSVDYDRMYPLIEQFQSLKDEKTLLSRG